MQGWWVCVQRGGALWVCVHGLRYLRPNCFRRGCTPRWVPGFPFLHILLIFDTVSFMSASLVGLCTVFSYGFNPRVISEVVHLVALMDYFFKLIYLFIFLIFLAALGLRCCARAFSSCSEQGLLFVAASGASHCSGFSCCRAQALGGRASVVVARGLQ